MIDPNTGEEIVEETPGEGVEPTEEEKQKAAEEAKATEDAKKKEEEEKERNRKGFEARQQQKPNKIDPAKLKEELKEELKAELKQELAEKEVARKVYPDITDDEFSEVKTFATALKISIKDALEKPHFKAYFKDIEVRGRVDGATRKPSNHVDGTKPLTEEEKLSERMSGNLPPGYKA